ncbi:unnamed protein product [Hermetia illucens]|uniref:Cytoplasmic phosphatidylinositol transfer protein 1 n=1 Tax=Hermetia illucens TaxID=343691 RepID=A0A7R8UVW5_HERIL|nr:cytoplasmic phosphatidylinositol transfer protein 1 [Hermetia illucens]CAD7088095.1 unnamed protein product [Hermetia illucens]
MVLTKEYRICMPLTVEEYQVGQLYMIARHSHEQSGDGAGVEVIQNCDCEDPEHGKGQFTEKRIHLSSRLPYWLQAVCPRVFYVTEKSWNYYPYTFTEYTCSFIPKFNVSIHTIYENNAGTSENCLKLSEEQLKERLVEDIDIGFDELSSLKHYKEDEDPKFFKSQKTGRGPLVEGWRETDKPIMCSYKVVHASFEVWGLQTRVEDYIQRAIRDILLVGHRQAFTWIDEWYDMTIADVREYESKMQAETNEKLKASLNYSLPTTPTTPNAPLTPTAEEHI